MGRLQSKTPKPSKNSDDPDVLYYFHKDRGFGQHKDLAIKLISQVTNILEEFDIQHCLISGTLLGHIRHNDFIPWDDDIDLLADNKIHEKMHDIAEKYDNINLFFKNKYDALKICFSDQIEIPDSYDSVKWKKHPIKKEKYCWPFIDVFTYETLGKKIKFFNKEWDMDQFFPFQKIKFLDIQTLIPKNPHNFLQRNYGNNYMTEFVSSPRSHKTDTGVSKIKRISAEEFNQKIKN
jgi:phosphorylcholine metabolism protein LicD